MNRLIPSIFVLSFLLFIIAGFSSSFAQVDRAYDRGLELLNESSVTEALEVWYNAYEQTDETDSRIGFEFIRVVTDKELRSYYEPATKMYFRALQGNGTMESRNALRQEIERLKPIIGNGIYRQWTTWWEERKPTLSSDMKGFWIQKDPTPSDEINERLIEHWLRISEAKDRFTKKGSTVYGTDDRALIFIRYGDADRVRSGILTLQSFNVRDWLERQLWADISEMDEEEGRAFREQRDRFMNRLHDAIYEYHRYPAYEIWVYESITENQQQPVIFLFGTDVRNDEFSLQTSLEDFIPEQAYYPDRIEDSGDTNFTRAGITPALVLQLLYYEQLIQADPFFEERLNNLRDRILAQGPEAFRGMDLIFRSESQQMIQSQSADVPVDNSTFKEMVPRIPLMAEYYRFLDESLQPVIMTVLRSEPGEAFLIDFNRNRGRNLERGLPSDTLNILEEYSEYGLTHNLITYDQEWTVSESVSSEPALYVSQSAESRPSISLFEQPHSDKLSQAATVLLKNFDPDSRAVYETPFSPALRGWNKIQLQQPEPLQSHPDSLEVADLVLGYNAPNITTPPFPFRVAYDHTVPYGETLLLHLEVYNLEEQPDGFTNFEMTYRIFPIDEQGRRKTDQTEFILTVNFTNEDSQVTENLEIETAGLNPGLYELVARFTDTESGQEKRRAIRFEVTD
ncbi:MAG: GWxTD domain-containing protein [Bacteroidetes bacterium]|jgi:GWxTD domain-containing protein|nr:GWxTD domain-containing protein [Bacteroidota bacterium]